MASKKKPDRSPEEQAEREAFISSRTEGRPAGNRRGDRMRANREWKQHQENEAKIGAAAPAFQEIMGREMDAGARQAVLDLGAKRAISHWATSSEALSRGVDPTQYGAKSISAEDLGGGLQPYYEEWRKRNPNTPLYDTTRDFLRWSKGQGDVNAFTAELDGLIQTVHEDGVTTRIITQEAVDRMGGEITIKGAKSGAFWVAPENAKWQHGKTFEQVATGNGMVAMASLGNPSKGVFGLGSDALKWVPKELSAPYNLLSGNVLPRVLGGTEALRKERGNQQGMFGDDITRVLEPMSEMVITGGAFVLGGPKAGAAVAGGFQASRAASGEQSWGDAALRTAAASAGPIGAQYGAVGSGIGTAAGLAASRAAGDTNMGAAAIAASGLTSYAFAPFTANWAAAGVSSGLQTGLAGGDWKSVAGSAVMSSAGARRSTLASAGSAAAMSLADPKNQANYFTQAITQGLEARYGKEPEETYGTRDALRGSLAMVTDRGFAGAEWGHFVDTLRPAPREAPTPALEEAPRFSDPLPPAEWKGPSSSLNQRREKRFRAEQLLEQQDVVERSRALFDAQAAGIRHLSPEWYEFINRRYE